MRYLPYYWLFGLFSRITVGVDVHVTSSELQELLELEKRLLRFSCCEDTFGKARLELEDILQADAPTGIRVMIVSRSL